jgi:hypothetical protein
LPRMGVDVCATGAKRLPWEAQQKWYRMDTPHQIPRSSIAMGRTIDFTRHALSTHNR